MRAFLRILGIIGVLLLVVVLAAAGLGVYTVRRAFPQVTGSLRVAGLQEQVEVYRDRYGIPQIYASNVHDLFMAQGYVHAQDRFYQMDFWRHQTAGRLSELYGSATLDVDRFLRTLGWQALAEKEYADADAPIKVILDAYAAGVNAYLQGKSAGDLSLEYTLLGVTGLKDYRPEAWTPANSLAWAKAMAWNLGGNLDGEIERAILMNSVGPEKTADYLPTYPSDHPLILPNPALGQIDWQPLQAQLAQVNSALGGSFDGIGSNNWVIAGSRTTTGKPLLANDPHLGLQMPSIWYEVGLHCTPVSAECPYDVTGFSFAGVPALIIGHNDRIAWGMTNVGPDVEDLYIEKINPANPSQYEVDGAWTDMQVRQETLKVLGGKSETLTIRSTRHGPIITDVYGLEDFAGKAGLQAGTQFAFALRWTALQPNHTFQAIFDLNKAQNFEQFRSALAHFDAPSQNFIYADVDGNIGYQTPGLIPIRQQGDGLLPVPGWNSDYEWTDYIPFDKLPYSYNPPQGYVATANNAVVGSDYPYLISLDWDAGYRAQRIHDMIASQSKISIDYIKQMQGDDMNLGAREVLPSLLALTFEDPKLTAAADSLRGWDGEMTLDSQPAAIYMSFFNALLADTFDDDLPEAYWPQGGSDNWLVLRKLLTQPDSSWWDNRATPAVEHRDDILRQAFAEGYAALEQRLGADSTRWTWGKLHTSTFVNQTVGQSDIGLVRALFNRGPFATAGGSSIVNATGMDLTADDKHGGDPFAVETLPSMRMIVDLGSLDNSLTVHTTGQSGHAYHRHYIDMADLWRTIQYHPMLWSRANVEGQGEAHQTLTP